MAFTTLDGITHDFQRPIPKNAEKSAQFILVRLLKGTSSVSNRRGRVLQTTDFSKVPYGNQNLSGRASVNDFLSTYNVGLSQNAFVIKTLSDNRELYRDLLNEFSQFFIQTSLGNHTAAFVFLYRALERLSYTVPLFYSSTATDYLGTFNLLKDLFDESSGELGIFKKFLKAGRLIDNIILDATYVIHFTSSLGHEPMYFRAVTTRYSNFTSTDASRNSVEITFADIPDLLITLRNRFFHARTGDGQKNIRVQEIHDSDEFFENLNKVFCSFIAVVTLHTIAHKTM